MLNSILMATGAIIFVSFWVYLAWDSHSELIRAEVQSGKQRPTKNTHNN